MTGETARKCTKSDRVFPAFRHHTGLIGGGARGKVEENSGMDEDPPVIILEAMGVGGCGDHCHKLWSEISRGHDN